MSARTPVALRSLDATGSSADNAAAESLNAAFKRETRPGNRRWNSRRDAHLALFDWLRRHNIRRHFCLGGRSPVT
jgi:transposase InsO family protein